MGYLTGNDVKWNLCNTRQIIFEVTERCNLRCYYCGYGSLYSDKGFRQGNDMHYEQAIIFMDYMASIWGTELNDSLNKDITVSFYGGEPLLNMPFIRNVISYIEKHLSNKGRTFHYSMTTNAILLDKYVDYLVDKDFRLLISLDGDEKGSSYRVFPNGLSAYSFVVKNIDRLREHYPLFYLNNVNFNAVLHNRNSVAHLWGYFKENFNKIPSISELNTSGIRPERKKEFQRMFRNSKESLFSSENYTEVERNLKFKAPTYKTAALYLLYHSSFKYNDYNELLYGKNIVKYFPTGTCLPFQKKVFITVSGKILPCERIGHQYALGYLNDHCVDLYFQKVANKYNHFYSKVGKLCQQCYDRKGCIQCMFYLENLSDDGKPIECKGFMNREDYKLFKNAQLHFFARNPSFYTDIMKNLKYR